MNKYTKTWLQALPFVFIFPGFFAYHWIALNSWISLFLGGYVNEISAVVCLIYVLVRLAGLFLGERVRLQWTLLEFCFALFMLWFAGVVFFHAVLMTSPSVTKNYIASCLQIVAFFLATRYVPLPQIRNILLVLTGIFSIAVLWAAQTQDLILLLATSEQAGVATYQDLARAYLITAAFGLVFVRNRIFRWLGFFVVISVLFLIGARSEIVGAVIFFAVFETVNSENPVRVIFWAALFNILGIFIFFISFDALVDIFPDNRLLLLFVEGANDGSVKERFVNQDLAWIAISKNTFFGDYGHYEIESSAGAYAHNWLSVWVDLGAIGLLLFAIVFVVAIFTMVRFSRLVKFEKNRDLKKIFALGSGFMIVAIVFALFAKHFADPLLAIAIGIFSQLENILIGWKKRV